MSRTAAVVLAAGGARRMGKAKQLLPIRGRSLLQRSVETAHLAGCSPVVVVVGANPREMKSHLAEENVLVVENRDWIKGMGGSIRAGVGAVESSPLAVDAIVVLLCDQPFVTSVHVEHLIAEHEVTGLPIVASHYSGTLGAPALFAQSQFARLLEIPFEAGARSLIERHQRNVAIVPCSPAAVDIDTPEDYSRWSAQGSAPGREVSYVTGS